MAPATASRINLKRITDNLRLAARKGDRAALALALDQMRILAHTPRYWERYLRLLRTPTARLVDLLVLKQGERIAHQKGLGPPPASDAKLAPVVAAAAGKRAGAAARRAGGRRGPARAGRRKGRAEPAFRATQPSLFD
jgi:hypothetical protein